MLNKKKIFYGSALIPVVIAIAMITSIQYEVEQKTYSYENGSFPPPMALGEYSDQNVRTLEEASKIVGYTIPEPNLPKGVTVQLIGIHGDRVVQIYASPNSINAETLDREFMYELQGIEIHYEKLPERLSHLKTSDLIEDWAAQENASISTKSNDRIEAVKTISTGEGIGGPFDKPARVITSISDDVQVSISGFYDASVLKSILRD